MELDQVAPATLADSRPNAEAQFIERLRRGDTAAFTQQSAVCAELHEFGICAGLLKEA